MSGKLQALDRGTDMVLAEHYTPVHHGRLTAATLETVTFDRLRSYAASGGNSSACPHTHPLHGLLLAYVVLELLPVEPKPTLGII
jgi:hypothetical protein